MVRGDATNGGEQQVLLSLSPVDAADGRSDGSTSTAGGWRVVAKAAAIATACLLLAALAVVAGGRDGAKLAARGATMGGESSKLPNRDEDQTGCRRARGVVH